MTAGITSIALKANLNATTEDIYGNIYRKLRQPQLMPELQQRPFAMPMITLNFLARCNSFRWSFMFTIHEYAYMQ